MKINKYVREQRRLMYDENVLKRNWPELVALRGVPQPKQWHPEGDAYVHTLMVMEQARKRYPYNAHVYWGTICHDLGKALTQRHWPSHYGHASLGEIPTISLLTRLGHHQFFIDQVCFLVKFHMHVHDAMRMKATTMIKIWLEACKVTVLPLHLCKDLCLLGVCDHYGRGGVDQNEPYLDPFKLYSCFEIISRYNKDLLLTKELKSIIFEINAVRET